MKGILTSYFGSRIILGYGLFFALFFFQLPWHGKLPGNSDTLLAIALSNLSLESLILFFKGHLVRTVLYPAHNFMAYGENCYGLAMLFEFFKIIFRSDIWSYYFFITVLFTLNSLGVFQLSTLYIRDKRISFLAGLAFSTAGFVLTNIDDPNVVFIFLPAFSIYLFELGIEKRQSKFVSIACLLAGLQIWFGFYVFLFQSLTLLILFYVQIQRLKTFLRPRHLLRCAGVYFLACAPLLLLYLYNHSNADVFSPYNNPYSLKASSLVRHHFGNVPPNNLIYSDKNNVYTYYDNSGWYRLRKLCFPGLMLPVFSLLGIITSLKRLYFFLPVFVAFFALSFGVHLPHFEWITQLPLGSYFRVASRSLLFSYLVGAIYFSVGLEFVLSRLEKLSPKAYLFGLLIIGSFVILENVPFPIPGFDYAEWLMPNSDYVAYFMRFKDRKIILDLPSTFEGRLPDTVNVWSYSRDIIYMNWQTYHHQIILGGVNSYIPQVE